MTPPPLSASCLSFFVSTLVSKHDSVSTQTPAYAKPMFCLSCSCFSSASFVAMCWVRLCPRLAQHAHVLFLFPFPLWCSQSVCSVILTPSTFLYLIQVACQSTCFCAEHHLHAQPFYACLFQKPWFTHCFGLISNPGLRKHHALCKSASSY